jgi:ubiquinone biosynthesis protein
MRSLLRVGQVVRAAIVYGLLPLLLPRRRRREPGPVRLRRALEELGATWIKLGQALALRFDLLPAAYCEELFKLLNEVAPFPYDEVRRVIREELGADVGQLFASFEREPFGAASIGQVHGAVLPSGERVAVKVQRPGVRRLIATDISLMYRLSGLIDITHVLGGTRSRDVIDEFARWTEDELDYTVEAMNCCVLRDNARYEEIERDPEVFLDYTTERVLTAERLDGIPIVDVIRQLRADRPSCERRLSEAGYDVEQAASNLVWNFLNQVYAFGVFHGDLHPANLLLLPGNLIGYVDFGIVGRMPTAVRQSLGLYASSLFSGDVDQAIAEFLRWVNPSSQTVLSAARDEMVRVTRRFLFDLEHERASKGMIMAQYQVDMLGATRRHRMAVDPLVVTYMKVVLTVDSVVYELAPELDLRRHQVQFFQGLLVESLDLALYPSNLLRAATTYRYRIDRALDVVDTVTPTERSITEAAAGARRWIQFASLAAAAGAVALFAIRSSGGLSTRVGLGVVAGALLYLAIVFSQTRKLPSPRYARRRRTRRVRQRIDPRRR